MHFSSFLILLFLNKFCMILKLIHGISCFLVLFLLRLARNRIADYRYQNSIHHVCVFVNLIANKPICAASQEILFLGIPTRPDTNKVVQLQNMFRGLRI